MSQLYIIVKTEFEAIHNYPNAPNEVEFLRNPHRHIFHVECEIEVFHDDRELEFIIVKRALERFIQRTYGCNDIGSTSCEMIATVIQRYLKKRYHLDAETYPSQSFRNVKVKVLEDNENGCYLKDDDK